MNAWKHYEIWGALFVKGAALLALCWIIYAVVRRLSGGLSNRLWQVGLAGLLALSVLAYLPPLWSISLDRPTRIPETFPTDRPIPLTSSAQMPKPIAVDDNPIQATATTLEEPKKVTLPPVEIAFSEQTLMANDPQVEEPKLSLGSGWVPWMWAIGGGLVFMHWLLGVARLRRLLRRAVPVGSEWNMVLQKCQRRTDDCRKVLLLEHSDFSVPFVAGLFQPKIVVPANTEWDKRTKEIVLMHELAHLRRHDLWFQLVGVIGKTVHWINPLAWWSAGALRRSAERAADEYVVQHGIDPADYADVLYQFVSTKPQRASGLALSMAERRSSIRSRVESLLVSKETHAVPRQALTLVIAMPLLAVALLLGSVAIGQDATESSDQLSHNESFSVPELEAKLRKLVVPSIKLENFTLETAINLLRKRANELDAAGGFNFILRDRERAEMPVTIDLQNIPMWELLQYVAEMTGVEVSVDSMAVSIWSPHSFDDLIIPRSFPIDARVYAEELVRFKAKHAAGLLNNMGVPFPDRSGALYIPEPSRILVRNSPKHLKYAEKVIQSLSNKSLEIEEKSSELVRSKLEEIVLPSIKLENASLANALTLLKTLSMKYDTGEGEEKGVQFVNLVSHAQPITIALNQVSLGFAIQEICNLARVHASVESHAIALRPLNLEAIQLQTFRVPKESALALLAVTKTFVHEDDPFPDNDSQKKTPTWSDILDSYGVPRFDGSSYFWNPRNGELVVAQTYANLLAIEHLVEQLGGQRL